MTNNITMFMKRVIMLLSLALTMTMFGCQETEFNEGCSSGIGEGTLIEVGVESLTSSRVIYDGYSTLFEEGDQVGVFGANLDNEPFTVGANSGQAISDNKILIAQGDTLYGYYPYNASYTSAQVYPDNQLSVKSVVVPMPAVQVQKDAEFSHITPYDFLIAKPVIVGKNTPKLNFQRLNAWIDFKFYNKENGDLTINSVTLEADKDIFITSGLVNVIAEEESEFYMMVRGTERSKVIEVKAEGDWATVKNGESATLRAAVLPVDMSLENVKITVNTSQGTFTKRYLGRNFASGTVHTLEFNGKDIYLPKSQVSDFERGFRFNTANLNDDNSYFSWKRSKESDNLIVFWEKGFGDDPSKCTKRVGDVSMKVDIDDMLKKMESFYALYQDELTFTVKGASNTDNYKMMIFLFYTDGWIANGGGVDDVIGAFWIAPSACKPVGQTVAHELGHSFQYQVACDAKIDSEFHTSGAGYRHDVGQGNAYWEVCANYQAWQCMEWYKNWSCEIPVHQATAHRGFTHEWLRYQCFYLMSYWEELHGRDILGRVWRLSNRGEDAIQTYKRITGTDQEKFNDEIWVAAAKEMTWSFSDEEINGYMRNMIDGLSASERNQWYINKTRLIENTKDGYYRCYPDTVTRDHGTAHNVNFSPQSYGYNAVYLKVPEAGTQISIDFQGLTNYPTVDDVQDYKYSSVPGWRWGLVACTGTGGWTPVYSEMKRDNSGTLTFTVPEGTKRLFFVVTGAPTEHYQKKWDSNTKNDYHFPYRFKVEGTELQGSTFIKKSTEEVDYTYTF